MLGFPEKTNVGDVLGGLEVFSDESSDLSLFPLRILAIFIPEVVGSTVR